MSVDIRDKSEKRELYTPYANRPFYQRNGYLAWIERAKRVDTGDMRIEQMLQEPEQGGVYMRMDHPPSRRD
jgi:uncharacterized protein YdeI (YjbR/CyaY-like superfamily)